MYGFSCVVTWRGHYTEVQVVYNNTSEDDPDSLDRVVNGWKSTLVEDIARMELDARETSEKDVHVDVWWKACWPKEGEEDVPDPPTDREILTMIAEGQATEVVFGWDT
jgi:hypothetical protein